MRTNNVNGYSIIEMLSTITIISILAALLLGGIGAAYEKSQQARCINNQHQIINAVLLYALDEDRFPSEIAFLPEEYTGLRKSEFALKKGMFDIDLVYASAVEGYYENADKILKCPKVNGTIEDNPPVHSYGMNTQVREMNYHQIVSPSEMVVIADSDVPTFDSVAGLPNRHVFGAIAGYADGHVQWAKEFVPDTGEDPGEEPIEGTDLEFEEDKICDEDYIFDYLGLEDNGDGTSIMSFEITNNNNKALSYIAFELPEGVTSVSPPDGGIYEGDNNNYNIENTTENPFYCIKFETIDEGIKNGESEIFSFTLSNEDIELIEQMQVQAKSASIIGGGTFHEGEEGAGDGGCET